MYFHAPCSVVLYFVVCKLYANKKKRKDNATRRRLKAKLETIDCDNSWDALKSSIYDASVEIISFRSRTHKDWFDENNREIKTN